MAKLKGKKKAEFLRRMAKVAAKKSKPVQKRRKTVKVIKKHSSTKSRNMAKKSSRRSKVTSGLRGAVRRGGLLSNAMAGIGGGVLGGTIANMTMPQVAPIAKLGGAFLGGGITGVVASVLVDGGLGTFGNLFGGNTQTAELSI